jgi:regulator of protease activity HflC (stomatin/prohibitin superfamily)
VMLIIFNLVVFAYGKKTLRNYEGEVLQLGTVTRLNKPDYVRKLPY